MTRIGAAYGASPLTFLGLAGVGDLFLTCSSSASRNYTVGYRLGKGETLPEIVKTLGSVAEGVTTTKALHELLKELGTDVNASIAAAVSVARCSDISSNVMYQVYDILYQSESFCILMD
jgi:glycerol-3-phosphate dehydrogenase